MGYSNITNLEEGFKSEEDILQLASNRVSSIQNLVDDFLESYQKKYNIEIIVIEDIAQSISLSYFKLCYEYIKPIICNNTNRFKMASLMELVIVQQQVLRSDSYSKIQNRELNALFGMTAALSLINCMITNAKQEILSNTNNTAIDARVVKILNDHQLWLKTKELDEMPIFINGQFYELMEILQVVPFQLNGY